MPACFLTLHTCTVTDFKKFWASTALNNSPLHKVCVISSNALFLFETLTKVMLTAPVKTRLYYENGYAY